MVISVFCLLRIIPGGEGSSMAVFDRSIVLRRVVNMLAVPRVGEEVEVVGERMDERQVSEWMATVENVFHYPVVEGGTCPEGRIEAHLRSYADMKDLVEWSQLREDLRAAGWGRL